jgi:hypothetical protein
MDSQYFGMFAQKRESTTVPAFDQRVKWVVVETFVNH